MLVIKDYDRFLNKNFTLELNHFTDETFLRLQQSKSIEDFFKQDYTGLNTRFKKLYKNFSFDERKRVINNYCQYIEISQQILEYLVNTNKLEELLKFTGYTNIIVTTNEKIKNMDKMVAILKTDALLKENDKTLYIKESYHKNILYEVKDIIFAKKTLDDWANKINSARVDGKELSPLEKFCFAYMIVKDRKYKESEERSLRQISRNIIPILNSDYCVCVGFCKLLNELCSRIGIQCTDKLIRVGIFHAINVILLNDEKYGIKNSLYYSDPTFDCTTNGNTFFSCLVKDLEDVFASYDDTNLYKNLDNNELQLFNGDNVLLKKSIDNTQKISGTNIIKALTAVFESQGKTTHDVANYLEPTFEGVRNNIETYKHTWAYQVLKEHGIIQTSDSKQL